MLKQLFLSCLYGSQRSHGWKSTFDSFLSCLYGSQLQKKAKELRRHRGKPISIYFTQSFSRAQEKPIESAFLALVKNFGQNSGTDALSLKP